MHAVSNENEAPPDLVIECGDVVVDLSNLVPRLPCKPKVLNRKSPPPTERKRPMRKRKSYRHMYPSKTQARALGEINATEVLAQCKIQRSSPEPSPNKITKRIKKLSERPSGVPSRPGAYNCMPSEDRTSSKTKGELDRYSTHMQEHLKWIDSHLYHEEEEQQQQQHHHQNVDSYQQQQQQQFYYQQQQQQQQESYQPPPTTTNDWQSRSNSYYDRTDYRSDYSSSAASCNHQSDRYASAAAAAATSVASDSLSTSSHQRPYNGHQQHYHYQQQHRSSEELQVEISPGVLAPLRGSEETWNAIEDGFSVQVGCILCSTSLLCIADADYVLCPDCRVVSSTMDERKRSVGHRGGVGLGLKARSAPRAAAPYAAASSSYPAAYS